MQRRKRNKRPVWPLRESRVPGGEGGSAVDHPVHYTSHPSGVECITVTEAFNFNVGNAIKYLWRAGLKNDAVEDLRKAAWYIEREIKRLGGQHG